MSNQSPLYPHQVKGLEFFRKLRYAANCSSFGVGKSRILAERFRDLVPPRRALLIATGALIGTPTHPGKWVRELRSVNPRWRIAVLTGRRAQRRSALYAPHHIGLINYEGLLVLGKELVEIGQYKVLGLDECHKLKNAASQVSRICAAIATHMDFIYGLTGSPILESYLDMYGVFRSIFPDMFGPDYYEWRDRYFEFRSVKDANGVRAYPKWIPKAGAVEDLGAAVRAITFRVGHEVFADFPREVNVDPVLVELPPAVRRVYNDIQEETSIALKSGTVTADNIRPRLLKMLQLCSGWCYTDAHQAVTVGPCTKAEALADLLSEIRGAPTAIWATSPPDMTIIARTIARFNGAYRHAIVYGETPAKERQEAVDGFNNGRYNVIIAHPLCLGEGVDLEAAYDVRFSRTWSANQYIQSRGRARRATSRAEHVVYVEILAADTIDESIRAALQEKVSYLSVLLKHADFQKADEELGQKIEP